MPAETSQSTLPTRRQFDQLEYNFFEAGLQIDEKSGSGSRDVTVAGPFKKEEKLLKTIALNVYT